VKYAFIAARADEHRVTEMCKMLEVSRSGYYGWLRYRDQPSAREQADQRALPDILEVHQACKARLGQRKLWMRLKALGRHWGRDRVARLMRQHGLKAKKKRPFRPLTTNSTHGLPVAPNVLQQDFTATAPNQKWVSDITYVWTAQSWMYLCVVIDLYARRVVGWALMDTLDSMLVLTALRRAIRQRHSTTPSATRVDLSFGSGLSVCQSCNQSVAELESDASEYESHRQLLRQRCQRIMVFGFQN
jgi:putative transposase